VIDAMRTNVIEISVSVRVQDAFRRKLLGDASRIHSACVTCGVEIIGSVSDGLPHRETEHVRRCSQVRSHGD
jgi:hypothetical protein